MPNAKIRNGAQKPLLNIDGNELVLLDDLAISTGDPFFYMTSLNILLEWLVPHAEQAYFVGEEGSATNDGLSISRKMDEPATAITAINTLRGGWTPVLNGAISINSDDGGEYSTFDLTSPDGEYVNVSFPNGSVSSDNINLTQNSSIHFKAWDTITNGSINVTKTDVGWSTIYGEIMSASVSGVSGNINISAGPGRLMSHVDHLATSLDPLDKSIFVPGNHGTPSEVFHRGFTADSLIEVGQDSHISASLAEFSGDAIAHTSGNIDMLVSGVFRGSVTTQSSGNFTLICGEREDASSDSISSTSSFRQLVAKGDFCVVDGMQALTYPVQAVTANYNLTLLDGGKITHLNRSTSGNITISITSGNIPDGAQGEFINIGTGAWNLLTTGPATLASNQPITPITRGEHVRWSKGNGNTFYLDRAPSNYTHIINGSYASIVLTNDRTLLENTLTADATIQISTLDVASGTATNNRYITIRDGTGDCGTYTITISLETGTINGQPDFVLAVPFGSITLAMDGTNAGIE